MGDKWELQKFVKKVINYLFFNNLVYNVVYNIVYIVT
ncbi:MAG: hypothetical protein [Lokiarchaeia virus VerdaV1]|uniref:Uncharacterized protein n=1 Tax=Lokiarchaeia virus VerdaV1 TaxID=3070170 RepID=A0AA35CPI4_9CAUD|nr:MAG: hypothetical protein QIT41_gp19 [Lokiarchaeia virus VerdaV1]BDI54868.1 MAG: hypothetical protein [Lokiarchaeia virus VerdaV1]